MTITTIYSETTSSVPTPQDDFVPLPPKWMRQFYSIVVPVFVAYCSLTMVVNMCVLLTFKWIKGPLSPTLRLTVSLALSDVTTSALLAFSYVYNSYLFTVHQIETNACVAITSEAVRMGGLITGTFHFLALAINHYIGAVYPFLYKKLLRPSTVNLIIALMWLAPPVAFLISFSSIPGQGYRTPDGTNVYQLANHVWALIVLFTVQSYLSLMEPASGSCTNVDFALKLKFRLPIFTLICALLFTMSLLYIAVILVLNKSRKKFQPSAIVATAKHVTMLSTTVTVRDHCSTDLPIKNEERQDGNLRKAPSLRSRKQQQQLQRKRSTLLTTLLIWSTFFLAWFPVATIYVLSCDTCVYSPHKRYHFKAVFTVSTVAQFGILTKTLINPIIYAVRIPEIRTVLNDFWTWCRRRGSPMTTTTPAKNRQRFDLEPTNATSMIFEASAYNENLSKTFSKLLSTKNDQKMNGIGSYSDDDLDS